MPVYSVEGKLGTGKTKFAVWQAQRALMAGRRVASNVDLRLQHLMPKSGGRYVRLPDKPTAFDLLAAGQGNPESYDEERNGVMILDELGTWLNSRSFQDKGRAEVLDWLIHARKHGWDVYLIVQDAGMIDRQVRDALVEYSTKCIRVDRLKIPIFSFLMRTLGDIVSIILPKFLHRYLALHRWGFMPRGHLVTARLGSGAGAPVSERWMYRGDDLHAAYDTRQIFRADYPHGAYSAWWYPVKRPTVFDALAAWLRPKPRPAPKPKLPAVAGLGSLPRDEAWRLAVELSR